MAARAELISSSFLMSEQGSSARLADGVEILCSILKHVGEAGQVILNVLAFKHLIITVQPLQAGGRDDLLSFPLQVDMVKEHLHLEFVTAFNSIIYVLKF